MLITKIKNTYIFLKLDFIIRFFYCRVPLFSYGLHRFLFWNLYSSNFEALDRKFETMKRVLKDHNITLKNKVVLEIGPGNSLFNAYNFIILGARKVILVDKFSRQSNSKKQSLFLKRELAFIRNKHKMSPIPITNTDELPPGYIEFINKDLCKAGNIKADFIYSVSVLEHIRKPEELFRKSIEILNPGGFIFHYIDLRDHYNFDKPFLFLKYSDDVWENFLTKEGLSYTNRWRYSDFKKILSKCGAHIIWENRKRFSLDDTSIHPKFKGQSDIDVGIFDVLAKKESKANSSKA